MTLHPTPRPFVPALTAALALAAVTTLASAQTGAPNPSGHDMSTMPGMAASATTPTPGAGGMPGMQGTASTEGTGAADSSMSREHMDMGPHMKMTEMRPPQAGDEGRAAAIVETLRGSLAKYRDYKVAIADHFVEYLPNIKQPMYHFTNYQYAFEAQSHFDAARPTSLLYKPTADGFELIGAMYTAPKSLTLEELDQRVPLSVAAWHEHVNICLPPKSAYATSDWKKFGFHGSIASASECEAAGGIFHPIIFNWMVHVYPFEKEPAKIWAH